MSVASRFFRAILLVTAAAVMCGTASAGGPSSLPETFKRVGDAVVVVRTIERQAIARGSLREARSSGLGSGVLISDDGKVLTAAHVIQTADAVGVEFPDGTLAEARIIAADSAADIALLQLARMPAGVKPVPLGDSDRAEVGEEIFVVGAPFGISHTLTVGHVSARRRNNATSGSMQPAELLQTDAAINQGNSGAPMFNLRGEVIGIVSRILTRSGGSEGLGFAVTSNTARQLMLAEPTVWTGIDGYLVSPQMGAVFNMPAPHWGLLVQRVAHGSLAHRLGLRGGTLPAVIGDEQLLVGGDIILAVDSITLDTPNAYDAIRRRMIEDRQNKAALQITILRAGSIKTLSGTIDP